MKTCPGCGSIDSDVEEICGICGRSLAGVPSKSLEEAEYEVESQPNRSLATTSKRNISRSGLLVLTSGLAMVAVGVSLAALTRLGPVGFLLIVPGVFLAIVGIDMIIGDIRAPDSPSVWNRTPPPIIPGGRK